MKKTPRQKPCNNSSLTLKDTVVLCVFTAVIFFTSVWLTLTLGSFIGERTSPLFWFSTWVR